MRTAGAWRASALRVGGVRAAAFSSTRAVDQALSSSGAAGGVNGKQPGRVVVVTSGKGGVGKTTVTASLGYGLASRGFRTCLIDFDIGLRNLDLHLVRVGIEGSEGILEF